MGNTNKLRSAVGRIDSVRRRRDVPQASAPGAGRAAACHLSDFPGVAKKTSINNFQGSTFDSMTYQLKAPFNMPSSRNNLIEECALFW